MTAPSAPPAPEGDAGESADAWFEGSGIVSSYHDLGVALQVVEHHQFVEAGAQVGLLLGRGLAGAVLLMAVFGLILAVGLLIAPGATAFLLTRRMGEMMAAAWVICLSAMAGGVALSFRLDSAPAPTIVLILTAMFLAALGGRQVRVRRATR